MKIKINLREAIRDDFIEVVSITNKKKKWGLIIGITYWMKNSKGKIENRPYRTTEATNLKEFGDYLSRKQIFIPK